MQRVNVNSDMGGFDFIINTELSEDERALN